MALEGQILRTAGGAAAKLLQKLANRNTDEFIRARDEMFREWTSELASAIREVQAYLLSREEELEARLHEITTDPQFMRLYDNFGYEAAREAIDERRRMLAYAAAGILDPDMSVERKARVERTLRELDTEDVRVLYGLSLRPNRALLAGNKSLLRKYGGASADALFASGCVRNFVYSTEDAEGRTTGVDEDPFITIVGGDVLRVLRAYLKLRGSAFPVPGRETGEHDRSETEALRVLASQPGLIDFLHWSTGRARSVDRRYSYTSDSLLEEPYLRLTFNIPHAEEPWPWLQVLADITCGDLRFKVTGNQEYVKDGTFRFVARATLAGPHDVLRVAADIVEAEWS